MLSEIMLRSRSHFVNPFFKSRQLILFSCIIDKLVVDSLVWLQLAAPQESQARAEASVPGTRRPRAVGAVGIKHNRADRKPRRNLLKGTPTCTNMSRIQITDSHSKVNSHSPHGERNITRITTSYKCGGRVHELPRAHVGITKRVTLIKLKYLT